MCECVMCRSYTNKHTHLAVDALVEEDVAVEAIVVPDFLRAGVLEPGAEFVQHPFRGPQVVNPQHLLVSE